MTNPIQYGAQQLNTYRQQYQQDNDSLKNKDIIYADKNNLDKLDEYLQGFLMGNSSTGGVSDFNGDGQAWQSSDYASLIGISEELYDDVYTTLYNQDPSTVSAEKVIKHIDGLDGNEDGTISATVKQQEEARVKQETEFAQNQYNTYKAKTLQELKNTDIKYSDNLVKPDASNDIINKQIYNYLKNVQPRNNDSFAKSMGISTKLYEAILNRMPSDRKTPAGVLALLDSSDMGGLNGSLSADNRDALEYELLVSGKVNSLFPDNSVAGNAHINSVHFNIRTKPVNNIDDVDNVPKIQLRMVDMSTARAMDNHTNASIYVNTDDALYTTGGGTYATAGEGDTYDGFVDAMMKDETINLTDTPEAEQELKKQLKKALIEYNVKENNGDPSTLAQGDKIHIWSVVNKALKEIPENVIASDLRKKYSVIPGKKRKTTTKTWWSKLWVPLLGYALYEIAQDDDMLNFS